MDPKKLKKGVDRASLLAHYLLPPTRFASEGGGPYGTEEWNRIRSEPPVAWHENERRMTPGRKPLFLPPPLGVSSNRRGSPQRTRVPSSEGNVKTVRCFYRGLTRTSTARCPKEEGPNLFSPVFGGVTSSKPSVASCQGSRIKKSGTLGFPLRSTLVQSRRCGNWQRTPEPGVGAKATAQTEAGFKNTWSDQGPIPSKRTH